MGWRIWDSDAKNKCNLEDLEECWTAMLMRYQSQECASRNVDLINHEWEIYALEIAKIH